MSENNPLCVYCNVTHSIIDILRPGELATTALQRLSLAYGNQLEALPFEEASRRSELPHITEPREISAATFDDMLNILPPVRWTRYHDSESFKLSERVTGLITATFVRLAARYFTFQDNVRLSHEECCGRVQRSAAYAAGRAFPPDQDR